MFNKYVSKNKFIFLISFIKGESNLNTLATYGVDFISKAFQLSDGSVVNAFIYDTCGQEKFNAINESYYKKADAVLLVYDITNQESFEKIKDYYCPNIKQFCKKDIPIILLGNKTDKEELRTIKTEEGIDLALQEHYKFKETSCLKNENVADAFEALIEMWNIENQKSNFLLKRTNSGEFERKAKTEILRRNTMKNKRDKYFDLNNKNNNENKTITLNQKDYQSSTPQKKSNGGCC